MLVLSVFAFLTPAVTQPFAAHWSDTQPIVGSEIKNRASVGPACPPPLLSRFSLSLIPGCAPAHGWLSPPSVKRAANGRVTVSGFKKKL